MRTLSLLPLLALAACGSENQQPSNVTKISVGDSAYVKELRALDDTNRTLTLRRAVIDSGNSCNRSRSSSEIGKYENMIVFNLNCERSEWAVFVAPTGDVQVRSCTHARQLGLPGCGTEDSQPAETNSSKS